MHVYLGMLVLGGVIIALLVLFIKSTLPKLYPLYQVFRFDKERLLDGKP